MKKFSILFAALFSFSVAMYAISDEAVIQLATTLYKQGKEPTAIAKELMAKGATMEQLQRLKTELEAKQAEVEEEVEEDEDFAETDDSDEMDETEDVDTEKTKSSDKTKKVDTEKTKSSDKTKNVTNKQNGKTAKDGKQNDKTAKDGKQTDKVKPGTGVYGSYVFRSHELTFEPQANIPTPKNYRLGAGDQVIIDIYGASQLQIKKTITAEGMITLKDYGPVKLAGLTIDEATRRIKSTYGSRYQGSQLMVTLGKTRSIQINIMGEVNVPGTYQLSAFASVFHALYSAGGITPSGTLRDIKVFRNSKQVASIDLYTYLMNGQEDNVRLEDGDVIIVDPFEQHVYISGNIRRSMTYELKKGETFAQLIYYAGGFSAEAYTSAVRVTRNNGGRSVLTVKNDQFDKFPMMDGDSVDVEAILHRLENTVSIKGAVFRPGQYGLSENLHTVSQLIAMADGPIETAFLGRGVLYRMKLDRTQLAIPIDLEGIINGTVQDIELKNEDQLYIPDNQNKLKEQTVSISGEVREPETFPFAENESVEDLILRAGGLTKRASTSKVDIIRRKLDPKATNELEIQSEIFTIEINDNMTVTDKGFILEPFDEVYVRMSPAAGAPMKATISGEVLFGGTYELKSKSERLSDLVRLSGGFTQQAYIQGAKLIRQMNKEEIEKSEKIKEYFATNEKDSTTLQKLDSAAVYTVGIDLQMAIANPGSDNDVILREGDVLYIPTKVSTVKINGSVISPNAVNYLKGKSARYYIKQAGGFDETAKRSKAYIVYPSGKIYPAIGHKVIPGSEIVVPSRNEKKEMTSGERMSMATMAVSMGTTVATLGSTVIAIVTTLKNN